MINFLTLRLHLFKWVDRVLTRRLYSRGPQTLGHGQILVYGLFRLHSRR